MFTNRELWLLVPIVSFVNATPGLVRYLEGVINKSIEGTLGERLALVKKIESLSMAQRYALVDWLEIHGETVRPMDER